MFLCKKRLIIISRTHFPEGLVQRTYNLLYEQQTHGKRSTISSCLRWRIPGRRASSVDHHQGNTARGVIAIALATCGSRELCCMLHTLSRNHEKIRVFLVVHKHTRSTRGTLASKRRIKKGARDHPSQQTPFTLAHTWLPH